MWPDSCKIVLLKYYYTMMLLDTKVIIPERLQYITKGLVMIDCIAGRYQIW